MSLAQSERKGKLTSVSDRYPTLAGVVRAKTNQSCALKVVRFTQRAADAGPSWRPDWTSQFVTSSFPPLSRGADRSTVTRGTCKTERSCWNKTKPADFVWKRALAELSCCCHTKQRPRKAHMKLTLRQQITQFAHVLQTGLFPVLNEELGELTDPAKRLVATLEMIPLARFVPSSRGWIGRPSKDRLAIASAFVAKAVYGFALTRQLLVALASDAQLRRICGWNEPWQVPHESTFSRAFDEFARMELPQFVHETLIRETQKDRLIGHIARDSTAIEARERFPETPAQAAPAPSEK